MFQGWGAQVSVQISCHVTVPEASAAVWLRGICNADGIILLEFSWVRLLGPEEKSVAFWVGWDYTVPFTQNCRTPRSMLTVQIMSQHIGLAPPEGFCLQFAYTAIARWCVVGTISLN